MNMISSTKKGMIGLSAFGLFVLAFLAVCLSSAEAVASDSDSARSYCVQMGYLYRSSADMNNGQGICEFPDKTWCDCQAYYAGQCGPRLSPNLMMGTGGISAPTASTLCQNSGGRLESVHTPYGDVTLCVFPNGRTCDIQSLYNGMCGGDDWLRYARSWLDGA
jgi:putative hemolysin